MVVVVVVVGGVSMDIMVVVVGMDAEGGEVAAHSHRNPPDHPQPPRSQRNPSGRASFNT
jgi:hypothetical protein